MRERNEARKGARTKGVCDLKKQRPQFANKRRGALFLCLQAILHTHSVLIRYRIDVSARHSGSKPVIRCRCGGRQLRANDRRTHGRMSMSD